MSDKNLTCATGIYIKPGVKYCYSRIIVDVRFPRETSDVRQCQSWFIRIKNVNLEIQMFDLYPSPERTAVIDV